MMRNAIGGAEQRYCLLSFAWLLYAPCVLTRRKYRHIRKSLDTKMLLRAQAPESHRACANVLRHVHTKFALLLQFAGWARAI